MSTSTPERLETVFIHCFLCHGGGVAWRKHTTPSLPSVQGNTEIELNAGAEVPRFCNQISRSRGGPGIDIDPTEIDILSQNHAIEWIKQKTLSLQVRRVYVRLTRMPEAAESASQTGIDVAQKVNWLSSVCC